MGRVIELFVDDFLAIDEGEPVTNPTGHAVFDTLVILDTARNYRTAHSVGQTILFGHVASPRRTVYNLTASNYFEMHAQGAKGPDLQVLTQFFHVGQVARTVEFEAVAQTLSLIQGSVAVSAKNAQVTFAMTDAAACNVLRQLGISQTIFVGSGGTGTLIEEDFYGVPIPSLSGPNAPEC